MKISLLCLALFYILIPTYTISQGTKKALLIGIGKYPSSGGWSSLNSVNDLQIINDALVTQGFLEANIKIIKDEHCTKENIIKALKHDLLHSLQKGDLVYFHFSGHGQQKKDINGDEIDGYDECLVPYDSPKKFIQNTNEGNLLITDDELNEIVNNIRQQLGSEGHLIVAIDACHSGTGTRGGGNARGSAEPMASPDYIKQLDSDIIKNEKSQFTENIIKSTVSSRSSMVAFFGSSQNQLNYEMTDAQGKQYGSLSYSISKHLIASKKEDSYRALFDKIKVEMNIIAPMQQPQAEGDLDAEILNGKVLESATYFKVQSSTAEDNFVIDAGFLQGVNEGSILGFYPIDTRNIESAIPITKGKVIKSMATSAVVELDSFISLPLLANTWIFLLEKSMGEIKIAVDLNISSAEINKLFNDKFKSLPYLQQNTSTANLFIYEEQKNKEKKYIYLSTQDNCILDSFMAENATEIQVNKMTKAITRYLQCQFLKKIEISNKDIQLEFKIIPIETNSILTDTSHFSPLQSDPLTGMASLHEGQEFQIVISNKGIKPAYFTLLDFQPDHIINILLPYENQTAEEMRILPGQNKLIPIKYKVWPPYGNELFKLIASSRPLDLRTAYSTRGSHNPNPFEKLFVETASSDYYTTRGSKAVSFGEMDLNIYNVSYLITKK